MARSERLMGGWRAAPYYIHASELGRTLTSILRRALTRSEISALGTRIVAFFTFQMITITFCLDLIIPYYTSSFIYLDQLLLINCPSSNFFNEN